MLFQLDCQATSGGSLAGVVILHGIGVGMLAVSGWLGGEMVYHHLAIEPENADVEQAEQERHHIRMRM